MASSIGRSALIYPSRGNQDNVHRIPGVPSTVPIPPSEKKEDALEYIRRRMLTHRKFALNIPSQNQDGSYKAFELIDFLSVTNEILFISESKLIELIMDCVGFRRDMKRLRRANEFKDVRDEDFFNRTLVKVEYEFCFDINMALLLIFSNLQGTPSETIMLKKHIPLNVGRIINSRLVSVSLDRMRIHYVAMEMYKYFCAMVEDDDPASFKNWLTINHETFESLVRSAAIDAAKEDAVASGNASILPYITPSSCIVKGDPKGLRISDISSIVNDPWIEILHISTYQQGKDKLSNPY